MFRSRTIGLDIGSHGIKMAEVMPMGRGYQLISFGALPLPRNAITVREVIDFNAVATALRTLVDKMGVNKSHPVALSLSGPGTFIKRVHIENATEEDLPEVIHWEGAQWIPFPVDEAQLDYEVVGVDRSKKRVDIILAAATKQLVQSYTSIVVDAGLTPAVLDIDAFALQNAVETNYTLPEKQVSMILHVGKSVSSMHVMQNGKTLWVRDLVIGGENLTSRIQERLKLDYREAETIKMGLARGNAPAEVVDEVTSYTAGLVEDVKRTVRKFYDEVPGTDPLSSVFLSGGGVQLPGLAKALTQELQVTTELVAPFRRLSVRKGILTPLETVAPIAAVCVGLAARRGIRRARN